jgi:transposase
LEVAGEPLRCQAAGVHRRERVSHLHDALEGQSSERREGLRQGAKEPGKEYYADRIHHPRRRYMGASMIIEGATDALAFEAYVEHFLAPTLEEGQVVVLDGLGAHRTDTVRELIEQKGADLLFLPSYSPDLNPIEEAFSKIKNIIRKVQARTREALVEAIALAISALTLEDVAGWFAHCGYHPQDQYS